MGIENVTIVGGTHGNEVTGVYFIKKWQKKNESYLFNLNFYFGNPAAIKDCRRYVEKDLNRCFSKELQLKKPDNLELKRAQELKEKITSTDGPADFIIDLHTTTGPMGPTIIITDDTRLTLNCAKFVVKKMPEVKIIREILQPAKNHFLTSLAPSGVIVEVGPIPQGVLRHDVFEQTEQIVSHILDFLTQWKSQDFKSIAEKTPFYEIIGTLHYPKNPEGELLGMIHKNLQKKEFSSLVKGDPLFFLFNGETINYTGEEVWPIFINEAAYYEENIAMVLTKKGEF